MKEISSARNRKRKEAAKFLRSQSFFAARIRIRGKVRSPAPPGERRPVHYPSCLSRSGSGLRRHEDPPEMGRERHTGLAVFHPVDPQLGHVRVGTAGGIRRRQDPHVGITCLLDEERIRVDEVFPLLKSWRRFLGTARTRDNRKRWRGTTPPGPGLPPSS